MSVFVPKLIVCSPHEIGKRLDYLTWRRTSPGRARLTVGWSLVRMTWRGPAASRRVGLGDL